ncbi:hypothetical protein LCGC14_1952760 [marine sediment metagenome]|uniref:Uncharacterized protein n=1 Tax=marine sediment metagenome TaxID=412755 RepID=A0A0F9G5A3_9ZZZZ
MAKPSEKAPGMEKALDSYSVATYGRSRTSSIKSDTCVACGAKAPPESFKDALSKKEYSISGMCQSCQDVAFAEPDEEPIGPDDPLYDEPGF